MGAWLKVNGEAIYTSRPFEVCQGKCKFNLLHAQQRPCFRRADELDRRPGHAQSSARRGSNAGKNFQSRNARLRCSADIFQDEQGLTVTPSGPAQPITGISNQSLANNCAAFCASRTTKAGLTTMIRARRTPAGFAAATWAAATSTWPHRSATRPAMSGVVRSRAAVSQVITLKEARSRKDRDSD